MGVKVAIVIKSLGKDWNQRVIVEGELGLKMSLVTGTERS